jgi:hypothetical protein
MASRKFNILVSYDGPICEDRDSALFKAAGRHSDASGMMLLPPYPRDHVWFCRDYKEASTMYKSLIAIGYQPKIDY